MKHPSKETSWHRLDHAATLFPLISNRKYSNVFRIAAQLEEPIDPILLQQAVNHTLPYFKNFTFRLRRGFFWYYFEPNQRTLMIEEEKSRPCLYIEPHQNHYLCKVLYFKNRISLEVFHAVTDGMGAMNFLKALVVNYLKLVAGENLGVPEEVVEVASDTEDSYRKNYRKIPRLGKKFGKAFRVKGKKLPGYTMGIVHGFVEIEPIKAYCKEKGVTLSMYLAAVYVWSILHAYVQEEGLKKNPIRIGVPVNLRKFFDSTTTLNFFAHITVSILVKEEEGSFDHILSQVKEQFEQQMNKDHFAGTIADNVKLKSNPIMRIMPLPLKNIIVKQIYLSIMKSYTGTLSNLGVVQMPTRFANQIKNFEFVMNPTAKDPIKCGVVSFEKDLIITIASQLESTYIQKEFFRKLAKDGFDVRIESNGAYYENV
ncbi:MAG: hypothetical protein JW708_11240 [Vallitaleaceae bacterium]|nr:hypothetical protein [Vallitaleaceae bacterium]